MISLLRLRERRSIMLVEESLAEKKWEIVGAKFLGKILTSSTYNHVR